MSQATPSQVAATARGPVEYLVSGAAPAVLLLHGTPGGYDQGGDDAFADAGIGSLKVSRPGYLRRPLSTGRTFAEQADAMAALLDALGIDRIVPHGVSGGGPTAIEFAARHPDRTSGLLLTCAVAQTMVVDLPGWFVRMSSSDQVTRLSLWMFERFPKTAIEGLLRTESTFDKAERARVAATLVASPERMDFLRAVTRSGLMMKKRRACGGADPERGTPPHGERLALPLGSASGSAKARTRCRASRWRSCGRAAGSASAGPGPVAGAMPPALPAESANPSASG